MENNLHSAQDCAALKMESTKIGISDELVSADILVNN
jgi:hypothetical protein